MDRKGSGADAVSVPLSLRLLEWARRGWRPAASVVAVMGALWLAWNVFNGNHGISVWMQKRSEDRHLRKDIQDLEQENARLRDRVQRLKSDPDAIEHEAREKMHYAKEGEIIYTLPAPPQATSGNGAGK